MSGNVQAAFVLWAAGLLAQQNEAQQNEVKNFRTSAEDIALGGKTFRSHCSPCHGLKAEGGRGPNLSNGIFYHGSTDSDLLTTFPTEFPVPKCRVCFTHPTGYGVVAYIRSLQSDLPRTTAADVAAGKAYFSGQGARDAIGVNGVGGRLVLTFRSREGRSRNISAVHYDPTAYVHRATGWCPSSIRVDEIPGISYE